MKLEKSEIVKLIREELDNIKEIETKASPARMAQRVIDLLLKQKEDIFIEVKKNPVAARQVVGYLAGILDVDLTDTGDQRAVGVQAKRMGVGAAPQEQPK
mgnify:FL=1